MSGLLDTLSRDFSHRLGVRRKMMAHLGLQPTDSDAVALREDLRETLLTCTRCPHPEVCEGWIAQNRPGTPVFCRGRDSFLRLEAALLETPPLRLSA